MDTKAAFEKWWGQPEQFEVRMCLPALMGYHIWQASRAAIEIDPEHIVESTDPYICQHCGGIGWSAACDKCIPY
ncbi:hypothetical protein ACMV8I_18740 [Ewingella sp. S1.OA.A_B6]